MDWGHVMQQLAAATAFGLLGIGLFVVALAVIRKAVPFSIEKEIAEDQNTALGVVMGAILLGLAIIVATAIRG